MAAPSQHFPRLERYLSRAEKMRLRYVHNVERFWGESWRWEEREHGPPRKLTDAMPLSRKRTFWRGKASPRAGLFSRKQLLLSADKWTCSGTDTDTPHCEHESCGEAFDLARHEKVAIQFYRRL